jgi:hydrogenase nickel incorporation protein HypB
MCGTCGCGLPEPDLDHEHEHDHEHPHAHDHEHRVVALEERILGHNDELAAGNRAEFAARGIVAVNLMSSPGSGKTTLLERTVRELLPLRPVAVLEGDQETALDADRIRGTGAPVVQINTGTGCHLDAAMVRRGLAELDPPDGALLFVENVGNLVCPALFDLGEAARVVVMSVPEGDDKPAKYPHMFRTADLVLVNKVDLLPHVTFDLDRCTERIRRLRRGVEVLSVSATRGDGLAGWYAWLDAVDTGRDQASHRPAHSRSISGRTGVEPMTGTRESPAPPRPPEPERLRR